MYYINFQIIDEHRGSYQGNIRSKTTAVGRVWPGMLNYIRTL